jgi:alpha-3'-ketoglucosidase
MRKLLCGIGGAAIAIALLMNSSYAAEVYSPVPEKITGVLNGAPPSDAIVLFAGRNLDAWQSARNEEDADWTVEDGVVTVNNGTGSIKTRQTFSDIQLHIEWSPTSTIMGEGQSRGNSGIFLNSIFEIQVLDSWENPTYVNGQAGSVYLQHAPLVNVSKPPGEWQSYDILFKAPVYSATGTLESPAFVTVFQNGVLVLNNVEILGATYTEQPEYSVRCTPYGQTREQDCSGRMPLTLQDHGQVVSFRNIWLREL